jgi:hypothetical protein
MIQVESLPIVGLASGWIRSQVLIGRFPPFPFFLHEGEGHVGTTCATISSFVFYKHYDHKNALSKFGMVV